MGVFDYVHIPCPNCGKEHEYQSKGSGFPFLEHYHYPDVPDEVMFDVDREPTECECGTVFKVDVQTKVEIVAVTPPARS